MISTVLFIYRQLVKQLFQAKVEEAAHACSSFATRGLWYADCIGFMIFSFRQFLGYKP